MSPSPAKGEQEVISARDVLDAMRLLRPAKCIADLIEQTRQAVEKWHEVFKKPEDVTARLQQEVDVPVDKRAFFQAFLTRCTVLLRVALHRSVATDAGKRLNALYPPPTPSAIRDTMRRTVPELIKLLTVQDRHTVKQTLFALAPPAIEGFGNVKLRPALLRCLAIKRPKPENSGNGNGETPSLDNLTTDWMGRLSHLTREELITEKRRLQTAQDKQGIGMRLWHKLRAVEGLLHRHRDELHQRAPGGRA